MLPEGFTRLYTGATGALSGARFEVLGRVRYGFQRGFWDEWYVQLEDGTNAWLTEDDHELALETEREHQRVPGTLSVGQVVTLEDVAYLIREVGRTTCLGIEGQIPSDVLPDETYAYADGTSVDGAYTLGVEFDDDPPTVFKGRRLSHDDVVLDDEGEDW